MTARATGRGPRALSRFFARHQSCGGGFDVGRPEGGLVRVTCPGCGASFFYESAAGSLPEGSAVPASALDPMREETEREPRNGPPAGARDLGSARSWGRESEAAPASAATQEVAGSPVGAPAGRRRRRLVPGWVDAVIIAAMICAAAIIVLSVAGVGEEGSDDESRSASDPERSAPAEARDTDAAGERQGGEGQAGQGEGDARRAPMAPADSDLGRARTFFSAYRIAIPPNWETNKHGSYVEFVCEDRQSDVRVYHEQRSGRPEEMEDELRRFIENEHPGADIGRLQRSRVGGADAASLTARFGGSVKTATVVAERPYLYLIVSRWDESASEEERAETRAVVNSFGPA